MSNRFDDRIHALVNELVESAPEPPPFPAAEVAAKPEPGPVRRVQRLALATLLLVFLVGSAVGITNLLSGRGDDIAVSGPAGPTTSGPTTTVSASETTTATTAATATTSAPSATTSVPTVTSDPRAATVAALDVQCPSFAQALGPLFAQLPDTPEIYRSALETLDGELSAIRTAIALLRSGDEYDQLTSDLDAVEQEVGAAQTAGVDQAAQSLSSIDAALTELASSLTSLGAPACSDLASVIP